MPIPYFPTQIYYFDFPDANKLNRVLKRRIRRWRKADEKGIVRSNVKQLGAWHSTVDMNLKPEFSDFANRVVDVAKVIYKELDYAEGSIATYGNMWANISPRYAFNRQHNHPGALWSGVYYIHCPKNCGRLCFRDPRAQARMIMSKYKNGTITKSEWSEVYYQAIPGRIILFPSWLEHTVEPNLSSRKGVEGERMSVAFNLHQSTKKPT